MILRGINFGHTHGATGLQGFIGDGSEYPQHRIPFLHPNFTGMTFVAKTITLHERTTENGANMDIDPETLRPKELFPKCIAINWRKKAVENIVGLTNIGLVGMLALGCWQKRTTPWLLSFMSTADTPEERLEELREFVRILKKALPGFLAQIGLQLNFSCPNTGIDTAVLLKEVADWLRVASELGIPLMPKFSVTQIPIDVAVEISKDENCDAICVSNTIPWKDLPDSVKIESFGSLKSPLIARGFKKEGGYSGPYLFPLVLDWVKKATEAGIEKPINAGGGIFTKRNILDLYLAGASSVFIGSSILLCPWDIWKAQRLIKFSNQLFQRRKK